MLRKSGHDRDAAGGGARFRRRAAADSRTVRGRVHWSRRRLRTDGGEASDDAAAPGAGLRQRHRESAQRAARAIADRKFDRRSCDVACRRRRTAYIGYRFARDSRLGLGSKCPHCSIAGEHDRAGDRGGRPRAGTNRHVDHPVGLPVGSRRTPRRGNRTVSASYLLVQFGRSARPNRFARAIASRSFSAALVFAHAD